MVEWKIIMVEPFIAIRKNPLTQGSIKIKKQIGSTQTFFVRLWNVDQTWSSQHNSRRRRSPHFA